MTNQPNLAAASSDFKFAALNEAENYRATLLPAGAVFPVLHRFEFHICRPRVGLGLIAVLSVVAADSRTELYPLCWFETATSLH